MKETVLYDWMPDETPIKSFLHGNLPRLDWLGIQMNQFIEHDREVILRRRIKEGVKESCLIVNDIGWTQKSGKAI